MMAVGRMAHTLELDTMAHIQEQDKTRKLEQHKIGTSVPGKMARTVVDCKPEPGRIHTLVEYMPVGHKNHKMELGCTMARKMELDCTMADMMELGCTMVDMMELGCTMADMMELGVLDKTHRHDT